MPGPLSFDAFLGWVNITDPNNIPPDARVISADDLLRYEKLGVDTVAAVNGLAAEVESFNADETVAASLAEPTSATRVAVDGIVEDSVTGLQETLDGVPAQVTAKLNTDVPPAVASAIAADSTIAAAATSAVNTKIAGLSLVKTTDPGIPKSFNDTANTDSHVWRNQFMQKVASITKSNYLRLYKGLWIGDNKLTNDAKLSDLIVAYRDRNGRLSELTLGKDGQFPQWVLDRWKARMGLGGTVVVPVHTIVTVKPDGTGDYLSPKLANDAFTPGEGKTLEVVIYPGRYTETEWKVKKGVHLRGTIKERCILEGALPDSATDTQISNTSTIWLQDTATLENLTITAKNMRYCVHSEAGGSFPDAVHLVKNCYIEHYGNQGAKDYRAANSLPAGSVWSADRAWGYGSSSGWYERFENTVFISRREAWYVHDNKDFAKPMNHDFFGCKVIGREIDSLLSLQSLGAGLDSRVSLYGCQTSFNMVYDSDSPWITEKPENQVANHSQINYTQDGLDLIGYQTGNRGRALKIESNSTLPVSTVRVSGTAATVLFGDYLIRDGGGGLKGYAAGYWDISGILVGLASDKTVNNTIGRRLGDCTAVNKTLTVTVDGGPAINVVFSGNHTADANATLIAQINAALGAAAVASEYDITAGENYPNFVDRETYAKNTGAEGIPRWNAVKQGTSRAEVALIQSFDAVDKFIGIALEPIPPGKYGRILTSGRLRQASGQIPGVTTSPAPGSSIYLSDTVPGQFSTAGTRKVMTCDATNWAKFQGAK